MNRSDPIDPCAQAVMDFWFADCATHPHSLAKQSRIWFAADPQLDEELRRKFGD